MHYLGGKARVGKELATFLNSEIERNSAVKYLEPFCGSCWVTAGITNKIPRVASDIHKDLIFLWQALQAGWHPPDKVSEEEYQSLKTKSSTPLRAFAGFGCSFGGKWFGGYARDPKSDRNYALNAKNSLLKRIKYLQDVFFTCCSYSEIPIDKIQGRVIYCDIPYSGTTGYKDTPVFDYGHFWNWVRQASHTNWVYVSEYVAPDDFGIVWEKKTRTDLEVKGGGKQDRIEKLFKYKFGI